jgi:hypothetical protein
MDTAKDLAAGMFRATLADVGVAGDKIDAIVGRLVADCFPTNAQAVLVVDEAGMVDVEIIAQEEPTVDFNDLVATVKVRQ